MGGWLARLSELVNPLGLQVVALPNHRYVMQWCTPARIRDRCQDG
jgi:hypothetical protein